jgi:hypothetical protein
LGNYPARVDNLIERRLDPTAVGCSSSTDAKALSKVIRRTFGARTPIQCPSSQFRPTLS